MTLKAPTHEQLTAALGDGAKGAMAGMAVGPIGAAAGGLLALASDLVPIVFGAESKPALSDAAAFITKAPTEAAQVAALKEDPAAADAFRVQALQIARDQQAADRQAQLDTMQATLAQQQAAYADTANARQQTVGLAQAGSRLAWASPVVSVIVSAGFFVSLGMIVFLPRTLDPTTLQIVTLLTGTLAAAFQQVVSFWIGSSAGSARKSELLASSVPANLLPNPAAVVPAADVKSS